VTTVFCVNAKAWAADRSPSRSQVAESGFSHIVEEGVVPEPHTNTSTLVVSAVNTTPNSSSQQRFGELLRRRLW
jgi:hypothetical protein